MSKNYELVKNFYDRGLWNKEQVKNAVVKSWITKSEYKKITGEDYDE